LVSLKELKQYYDASDKQGLWKKQLGHDLNWHLSFAEYKESERTKHVHRLHPYKGKFIPQLVEYFLDSHTDEFKKQVFFRPGDIVLDPFCGSGTTLVQANELGLHAIGIDISAFNVMISNVKIEKHDLTHLRRILAQLTAELTAFQQGQQNVVFEQELLYELARFNSVYFPTPDFRRKVKNDEIDEDTYAAEKQQLFLPIYNRLLQKYGIEIAQKDTGNFLNKWFLLPVRKEIDFLLESVKKIQNEKVRDIVSVILSRTARSCRATTHADLATLKDPVLTTYYCKKHGKICKPIFSISEWWRRYTLDTLERLEEFDRLRTNTMQVALVGDSRTIDIWGELRDKNPNLAGLLGEKKIRGIFSSPPYVGLIDYHDQHAYAYEMFGFERKDDLEIGPLYKGQGFEARTSYVRGIADVLQNCKRFLQSDFDVFLVANDKFNLYPQIAIAAGMKIVQTYKRPVLNRVEKDRSNAYSETIFHMKGC